MITVCSLFEYSVQLYIADMYPRETVPAQTVTACVGDKTQPQPKHSHSHKRNGPCMQFEGFVCAKLGVRSAFMFRNIICSHITLFMDNEGIVHLQFIVHSFANNKITSYWNFAQYFLSLSFQMPVFFNIIFFNHWMVLKCNRSLILSKNSSWKNISPVQQQLFDCCKIFRNKNPCLHVWKEKKKNTMTLHFKIESNFPSEIDELLGVERMFSILSCESAVDKKTRATWMARKWKGCAQH